MTEDQVNALQWGDMIRNKGSGRSYVVVEAASGENGRPVAIRSVTIANPQEWEIVERAK